MKKTDKADKADKAEKKKRGPHPGKGLPIGHVKCDYCRKPLALRLAVIFQGEKFHPAGCAPAAIAERVGEFKAIVRRHFGGAS